MDAAWLSTLNEQQRAAATFGDAPLLIIAGAGTGKTNTLAHRVACLIARGVSPARILLLTFTRRASAEMIRRVERLLAGGSDGATKRRSDEGKAGERHEGTEARRHEVGVERTGESAATQRTTDNGQRADPAIENRKSKIENPAAIGRIWGGTFHAVGNRLLRVYAKGVGLGETFTVLDRSDSEDLLNTVRSELGLDKGDVRFPRKGTCMAIYSRCVSAQEPIEDALKVHFPWCGQFPDQLKSLFKAYVARKQEQNILDYDDLLLYWFHLMQDESLAADVRRRFDAVLVDEYQDTNLLQANILQKLCPDGRGLTVVGDDAQSIYSFRAATVHNILDFPKTFPAAEVLKLEQNYRSVQPILDATNAVIAQCPKRYNKDLFSTRKSEQKPRLVSLMDEDQQNEYLIKRILEHHEAGISLRRQAVLFRAAHHSDSLEVELARRNIPFVKYGGLKFLEAAHVKDALAILRLADNARDVTSAFRVLQLLDGIGPGYAKKAIEHLAAGRHDLKCWQHFAPPPAASEQWKQLVDLLVKLAPHSGAASGGGSSAGGLASSGATGGSSAGASIPLTEQIAMVRRFYTPILERRYDQAHIRKRDLEQLEQVATNFTSRSGMLTELTLDPPASTQDLAGPPLLEEDYLILSTIHSAKGCEWDVVYVIHAADGNIPSDMSTDNDEQIEEERRLFYVALTRARDFLEVCFPLKYYHKKWGKSDRHSYAQITRFLPESILDRFERVSLERAASADSPADRRASSDIRKKIATMWE